MGKKAVGIRHRVHSTLRTLEHAVEKTLCSTIKSSDALQTAMMGRDYPRRIRNWLDEVTSELEAVEKWLGPRKQLD